MTEPTMVPYPGMGSGHAGSATSKERQEIEDASGLTATRQMAALSMVNKSGSDGVTVAEVEEALGVGHGQASSALSHLHRAGRIVRLKDRRKKQELYVARDFINGRTESPYNPRLNRKHPRFYSDYTVVEAMKAADLPTTEPMYRHVRRFLEALP